MKITKPTLYILILGIVGLLLVLFLTRKQGTIASPSGNQAVSSNSSQPVSKTCQEELTAAAANGFATGTILVAFTSTTTWPVAQSALANAGASTTETIEDFSVNGIIQGNVLPGEEIATACTLRANPAVRYAGLNTIFTLAQ